ncbi:IclR family transcriptional regulator [Pseudonocardia sp.]|uniref:IclR family transcriptional regulator n=1 Tax=Pseudonocardia sp. TaxID=60912 RepID=UPI003D13034C
MSSAAHCRSAYERADAILGAFDADHPSLSLSGLTARTGLPKTTLYRSLVKMLELGWVTRNGARYQPGNRLFEFAGLCGLQADLRAAALPCLEDLYEVTHETVHLAVLDGSEVFYVEKLVGHRVATPLSRVGGRMPAYCTALGKVLTAYSAEDVRARFLGGPLVARTSSTIVSASTMERELRQIERVGVGFDREETVIGLMCIAAPVHGADGRCVAAVSVAGPSSRLLPARTVSRVREAAAQISRKIANRPPSVARARSRPGTRPATAARKSVLPLAR